MLKLRVPLSALAVLFFVVAAQTQDTSAQAGKNVGKGSGSGSGAGTASGGQLREAWSGAITSFVGGNVAATKGQPFSADIVDETDQFLADGNHIHREMHGKVFRDSEGRTRTESDLGLRVNVGGEPYVHITILDPVQHRNILLNPRLKEASVQPTTGNLPASAPPPAPAKSDAPVLIESLRVIRQAQQTASTASVARPSREDLGTSTMEGFTVTGMRISHTIPAGERGNDKPMTTTNETWFSRDLGVTLLTKSESPETGVHTHKLVNIRAGEPDPLLFQIPVDYTVKEQPLR
jgi:hypothetical protein